ncbi:hypothetical protein AB205_0153250 [Aquarana catesbeiana]|uniref:Peptidase S1 domain-containing protein n=2 Tax=Aquarana catesbeiana TaxID=8400 RepID=A0A2G9RK64_AQUCT|nr:hypothetical protein AB205_0153250 [Aquarana catesbeiana]
MFITEKSRNSFEQMDVLIKQGSKRNACLEDVKKIKHFAKIADIRDFVTDQFLCTGGIDPVVDPQTCGHDGATPLIINYRGRYIQVGVTSWGTVDSCHGYKRKTPVPATNRDFHVNLFSVLPWIQQIVKDELTFIGITQNSTSS